MVKIKNYLFLVITFFIYSLSLVFSKIASMQDSSFNFIVFYVLSLFIMCIYAVIWQLILKKVPLSIAFPTKAITILFSLILGCFIFNEVITFKKVISVIVIMIGIVLVGYKDDE